VIENVIFPPPSGREFAAVFVTHKRFFYLDRSLRSFVRQPASSEFDLIISLDFPEMRESVLNVIRGIKQDFPAFEKNIRFVIKPAGDFFLGFQARQEQNLDQHIFFAIARLWDAPSHRWGMVIEEDLELAPDFIDLAINAGPVLENDISLFCLSGWNDNAYKQNVNDSSRLLRTNVFPGLGWMVTRAVGLEISSLWPGYSMFGWDQWLRTARVSQGRECVSPEIPRIFHFGRNGVHIKINDGFERMAFSNFSKINFNFDQIKLEKYDSDLRRSLARAKIVSLEELIKKEFKFEKDAVYLVPHGPSACGEILPRKFELYGENFCRMTHRGLFEIKLTEISSIVYFADSRFGAEWLPPEYRTPLTEISPSEPTEGETCEMHCKSLGYICSYADAAHVDFGGYSTEFSCKKQSVICPCIPPTSVFDFSFHQHQ